MKHPNFTSAVAREMAYRAHASRKARLEAEAQAKLEAARVPTPEPDDARRNRVLKQIDQLLDDMANARHPKDRLAMVAAIARLWPLASPTAGVLKPARQHREVMRQL